MFRHSGVSSFQTKLWVVVGSSCNNGQASGCLFCVLGDQVSIRRRETERQEATRLQSHAYLKQLDEAEVSLIFWSSDPIDEDIGGHKNVKECSCDIFQHQA